MHSSAAMWRWLICCLALSFPAHVSSFLATPLRATTHKSSCVRHLGSLPHTLEVLVQDALDSDRKIVVVTGGVLSGIGKGVTASSIGVVSFENNRIIQKLRTLDYLNLVGYYCSSFELWDTASLP